MVRDVGASRVLSRCTTYSKHARSYSEPRSLSFVPSWADRNLFIFREFRRRLCFSTYHFCYEWGAFPVQLVRSDRRSARVRAQNAISLGKLLRWNKLCILRITRDLTRALPPTLLVPPSTVFGARKLVFPAMCATILQKSSVSKPKVASDRSF
jgi:hypothetical protein